MGPQKECNSDFLSKRRVSQEQDAKQRMSQPTPRQNILFACFFSIFLPEKPSFSQQAHIDISLDLVLQAAVKNSSHLQLLQSELHTKKASYFRNLDELSPRLESSLSNINQNLDAPTGSPLYDRNNKQVFNLGFKKQFSTGTSLHSSIEYSLLDQQFKEATTPSGSANLEQKFSQARLSFQLKQQLYRNFFGNSYKTRQKIAEIEEKVIDENVKGESQTWLVGIIEQYYLAWLLQARWQTAKERLAIQRRLVSVTQAKLDLGTAEKSDLLQVESAFIESEQQVASAHKNLQDIWQALVIRFGLSEDFISYPLEYINILLDYPNASAKAICQKYRKNKFQGSSYKLKKLELSLKSLTHQVASIREAEKPDIFVALNIQSNGIDQEAEKAAEESAEFKQKQVNVMLGINAKLGYYKEKSSLLQLHQNKLQIESLITEERQHLEITRRSKCSDLALLEKNFIMRNNIYKKQKQRIKLEEQRFRLSQIDLMQVIQALNDMSTASFQLKNLQKESRIIAWHIRELDQNLNKILTDLMNKK